MDFPGIVLEEKAVYIKAGGDANDFTSALYKTLDDGFYNASLCVFAIPGILASLASQPPLTN